MVSVSSVQSVFKDVCWGASARPNPMGCLGLYSGYPWGPCVISPPLRESLKGFGEQLALGGGEWAGLVPEEQSSKERRIFGAMWGDSGSPTTAVVYGVWRRVLEEDTDTDQRRRLSWGTLRDSSLEEARGLKRRALELRVA